MMEQTDTSYEEIEKEVKKTVSPKRFAHSLNVSRTAQKLAILNGENIQKAKTAGILHDITKEFSLKEHLELMQKYNVSPEDVRVFDVDVFHGFTGSLYAQGILGIDDKDILNAIKHHIVGRARMTVLEKIVFISDCISEERDYEGVEELRRLAEKNLNLAIIKRLIKNIDKFSFKSGKIINPNAYEAYNDIICEIAADKKPF